MMVMGVMDHILLIFSVSSGNLTALLKMAIEIVDFPIKNGGSFHSYVSLPEGKSH